MSNTPDSREYGPVSVIGAGWLGLPLARSLRHNGVQVSASATTAEGVAKLTNQGLHSFQLALPKISNSEPLINCQSLVICIPPRLRQGKTDYPENIEALIARAEQSDSAIENVLLLSTTAVYNGLSGDIDENAQLDMDADKVAILNRAEKIVLNAKVKNRGVLRLAGLLAEDRHPGRFFSKGRAIPNPNSVVNLIHRDDVIGIIMCYLSQLVCGNSSLCGPQIINAAAPNHPNRGVFYRRAAAAAGLPNPILGEQHETAGKQIVSRQLQALHYTFKYPDMLAWLPSSNP